MRLANNKLSSAKGIALVTALMACAILFALALLVIQLSTGDLKVSAKSVGNKKAMSAAETGIHQMMQVFDPLNSTAAAVTRAQVDPANDPLSVYTIFNWSLPTSGPTSLPLVGYSIGGGQSWGQRRYEAIVRGENTGYDTKVDINTGVGFGPVEITTMHR